MIELLEKIISPEEKQRDFLVDELNDLVESGIIKDTEVELVIERLSELLELESDPAVKESIFNLMGTAYEKGSAKQKIVDACVKYLSELSPGCLVHAIPIIASSERADKKQLLEPFLKSGNVAVKTVTEDCLKMV